MRLVWGDFSERTSKALNLVVVGLNPKHNGYQCKIAIDIDIRIRKMIGPKPA